MNRFLLTVFICLFSATAFSQIKSNDPFSELRFRFIGPDGNRAIAVVGEPGNSMVSYVGAASGGIFKTIDGGIKWKPIFDVLARIRNPLAHNKQNILKDFERNKAVSYCQEIVNRIEHWEKSRIS